jgi:diphthine-ammonia ligase
MDASAGWAALASGGKDSVLALQKAIDRNIPVRYIVTVRPRNPDSYMFHTSNLDAVRLIAGRIGCEYVEVPTEGNKEEEVADLEHALEKIGVSGIVTGAIGSVYQRERLDEVARRLSIRVFAPLWHMDPEALLREVSSRMDAIIVVCAADGLDTTFLGAHIDEGLMCRLMQVADRRKIHLAGEGGEYETLTLNAPCYHAPLTYRSARMIVTPGRSELVLEGLE